MAVLIRRGRIEKPSTPEAGSGAAADGAGVTEAGDVLRLEPDGDPAAFAKRLAALAGAKPAKGRAKR